MSLTQTSGSVSSDGAVLSTYAARCHHFNPLLLSACLKKKVRKKWPARSMLSLLSFSDTLKLYTIYIYVLLSFAPIM